MPFQQLVVSLFRYQPIHIQIAGIGLEEKLFGGDAGFAFVVDGGFQHLSQWGGGAEAYLAGSQSLYVQFRLYNILVE